MNTLTESVGQTESHRSVFSGRKLAIWVSLACGVIASIFYVAFDAMASTLYPGYRYADQAVSELSAIGAPTLYLYQFTGPIYSLLMIAFGVGLWLAARDNRALRITAGLILGYTVLGLAWPFFPMHQRGQQPTLTDTVHIILAAASVMAMVAVYWWGSNSFGRRFRTYTLATLLTSLLFGAATFLYAPRLDNGLPTPGMGITERINIFLYLLWVIVLAFRTWRGPTPEKSR